jgi:hypothetical protein
MQAPERALLTIGDGALLISFEEEVFAANLRPGLRGRCAGWKVL